MPLQDVLDAITFDPNYPAGQEADLRAAITTLYNGSPTARQTFDRVGDGTQSLEFIYSAGAAFVASPGEVTLDADFADDYAFLDETGTSRPVTLERVLMHEVIHAVDGLSDEPNDVFRASGLDAMLALADYRGSTVILTNTIMNEVGEATGRVTYFGVGTRTDLPVGTEYSNDETVDAAFNIGGTVDMSVSGRTTNDVLVGDDVGNDSLVGANGRDFLWGRGGDDTLQGGGGNDSIEGGAGTDIAEFSGDCDDYTVTVQNGVYTVTDDRAGSPDGTDTLQDVEYASFADGTAVFTEDGIACGGQNVVLLIDVSGSMGDELAEVKAQARDIVDAVFGTEQNPLASRLAIITFNDTGAIRTELSFTDQETVAARRQAALDAIAAVSILGGGQEPLNGAVLSAANGDAGEWLGGLQGNRVVVFSDEPAADPQLRSAALAALAAIPAAYTQPLTPANANTPGPGPSFLNEIDNFETPPPLTLPAQVFPVLVGNSPAAQSDLQELADATGGQLFTAANASEVVQALVQAITETSGATDGPDSLDGSTGDDAIDGLGGNDTISGLPGDDSLNGGTDDDVIGGGTGNDTIHGNDGNDTLYGGDGDDVVAGNDGDDVAAGKDGNDTVNGGAGNDSLFGQAGEDVLRGGDDDDRLYGGDDADSLAGNDGNDLLFGGDGPDTLRGGDGNDQAYGQEGDDVLFGGADDDRLDGGEGMDVLDGEAGSDTVRGGDGDDVLDGGDGDDFVVTGDGADIVVVRGDFGDDTIVDFTPGTDRVDLRGLDPAIASFDDLVFTTNALGAAVLEVGDDSITFLGLFRSDLDADSFLI